MEEAIKVDTGRNPETYRPPVARAADGSVPGDVQVSTGKSMGNKIDEKLPDIAKAAAASASQLPSSAKEAAATLSHTKSTIAEPRGSMAEKVPSTLGAVSGHPSLGIDGKKPLDATARQEGDHQNGEAIAAAARGAQSIRGEAVDAAPKATQGQPVSEGLGRYDELEGRSLPLPRETSHVPEIAAEGRGAER